MTSHKAAQAQQIFTQAIELADEQRPAFLEEACGGDAELRREVEGLLASLDEAGGFLSAPTAEGINIQSAATIDVSPIAEKPGSRIGRYKLLQLIGEGGFGLVFMAEQEHPVRRKVALKIIKLGMDTKQVIARFEAERQALAMMDHPNIARVFDAGATETGRPYFVMELVRGVPITTYCDDNKLATADRLRLFMQVCQAVHHAHQKGIIHRDLKPSNVLVTMHDDRPVPKVIDFGIAKATNARLTELTLFTEYRQFIGTPQYMSPEQAKLSGIDVDTRSDVYSLGVLLYELLTGTTPFTSNELRGAAYERIRQIIREVEPPRPSTRLSTLGQSLTSVAAHRGTDGRRLAQLLRGELDWIVMRCLEKDRTRRYESASALMADIGRHLADEPVQARPSSAAYRFLKLVRRHKAGFVAASIALLGLATGLAAATYGLVQATHERDRAVAATLDEAKHDGVRALPLASLTLGLARIGQGSLIRLDDLARATQRPLRAARSHRKANAMPKVPRGFHAASEHALKLSGADAFLRRAHEMDSLKPQAKRQVAILENGADAHGELLTAGVALAQANTGRLALKATDLFARRRAMRAGRAVRPHRGFDVLEGRFLVMKPQIGKDRFSHGLSPMAQPVSA